MYSIGYAQQYTVSGTVTSADDGTTLPGVSIAIKGTTVGTITNIDGRYTLNINKPETAVLLFAYVGMRNIEIPLNGQKQIDVALETDVMGVDEVIVVGYGVQKKSLVTGSISSISNSDIEESSVTRIEQAMQGRVPGVFVAQNSGEPGGAISVKIRGTSSDGANDPIYIVDGVSVGGMEYLNPSDIESMEILKDAASSAIYGAEGGNGVILITTKKGKKGDGRIEYRYSYGLQDVVNKPNVMDANEYKNYFIEATTMEGHKDLATFQAIDPSNGTNWVDEIFQVAAVKEHQISLSGGSDKSTYYISSSILNQDGIVGGSNNNMKRYTFRSNLETDVNEWISAGSNVSYSHWKKNPLNSTDQYGGIVTTAMRYDPTVPTVWANDADIPEFYRSGDNYKALVKDADGKPYTISDLTSGEMWNPLAKIAYTDNQVSQDKIVGDIHADFKPVKWAKLTSRLFVDMAYQVDRNFNGRTMYGIGDQVPHDTLTNANETWNKWFKFGSETFLTLEHQFGDHYIQGMGGMSYENYKHTYQGAKGYNIPYGDSYYGYPSLGQDVERNEIWSYVDNSNQGIVIKSSYFGRVIYNYQEKYLLQGSLRRDGLSKFGPDKKYGTFPSFSAGWNIHNEEFFKNTPALDVFSNVKARFSWGKNGSAQNLSSFPYLTALNVVDYVDGTPDGNLQPGKVPGTPGNSALLWETNVQTNAGLDVGLLKSALTFSLDFFNRVTTDQLANKSDQPLSNGLSGTAQVNDGEIMNKGIEMAFNYRGQVSDFKYYIGINASYLKNEVTQFGVEEGKYQGIGQFGDVVKYQQGEPVWHFFGYEANGIFQNQDEINSYVGHDSIGAKIIQKSAIPGDVKWVDQNGDGKISAEDRIKLGKPLPDWYYGLNLGFEFKGFDVNAFFQGTVGNQIFWVSSRNDNLKTNRTSVWYEERWTGEGTSNKYPRATYNDKNKNYQPSSLNVYDGNYFRLKNLSVGYTIPSSLTNKVKISKLKIYYTGTNLLTISKYPGVDPEIGSSSSSLGVDVGIYPTSKIHTFGVMVNF